MMKPSILSLLMCLLLLLQLSSASATNEWWDTNWTKCRNITIANTGNTTLSKFPAYIDLKYYSDMQPNYHDIRFINTSCANSGSELDFEIETYSTTSADVWVEIDNLPAAGTTIAVYYGNASAASGENASGTWVSSHKGVWHLSESTNAENQDSTSNSNNGIPQNSPLSITGKIGKALNFNYGNKDGDKDEDKDKDKDKDNDKVGVNTLIELGTKDSLDLSNVNTPDWTISLWVKPDPGFANNEYPVMYAYGDYLATVGLSSKQGPDDGLIENYLNDASGLYSENALTTDAWNHVVVTRDDSKTKFYLNGNANGSGNSVDIDKDEDDYGSFIGGWTDTFSNEPYAEGNLKGVIDEVRVSNVVRTPDWIKQSYDLVQDQGVHVSIGDEVEAQLGPRLLGNLNVDNRFEAYISTDDSERGTLLASGGNWPTTYTLASSLLDGQEYYLHIKATDTGGPAGFLGDFELTDTSHRFSNGLTTLNTNTVNWSVSTSGWSNYELASAFGVNGVNPWKAQSGVNASAQWIWSSDNSADNTAYFSTKIVAATRVPVLEYRFDELSWTGSANEVIDSSGNNYNGTAIGGITTATGKICHAAEVPNNNSASIFEAVDTGVDLDTVIGSSGTISLWYKGDSDWNSGTDKRLFDATDGNKYFFADIRSDGRVKFYFEDGSDADYQKTTNDPLLVGAGVWKHLTFVWDVTNITTKIFVDGVEQSLSGGTGGTTALSGLGTLYFGDNRDASYTPGQSSASGLIDEALVFDSVLTTTQIQAIFTNQNAGNNYDGTARTCPTPDVNHYRIEHDTQGFTCEAEAMTIKACANEDCSDPYTDPVSITLSPSGWSGGNTITFENDQGGLTKTLSVTNAGSITLTKTIAIPNADLRCFNGSTEISCEIEFVNAGFEFFGTTTAIKTLGDQAAETNFSNVNIRAVRDDAGVCKALLKDSKDITFIYNCEGPATCLTPLAGIPLNGVPSGDQSGTLSVTFAADGTAPLSMLNYADVGRLNLTVLGEIDGVTLTSG